MMALKHAAHFKFTPIQPYNFELTVRKPAGWSWFTPFEKWEKGTIWSGFWFEEKIPLGVKARSTGRQIIVDVYSAKKLSAADVARLEHQLNESLGTTEDLRPFYRLMRRHPMLKHLVRRLWGMHEGWGMNIFSSLTLAIMLQMAPIKRSQEMWDCLIKNYGEEITFDGKKIKLWPAAKTIAGCSPKVLAKRCKLGYRARFLVKLAKQLMRGFPSVEELAKMTPEAANEELMELFGVGEYSAGFASPHPSFSLDVWSIKIFYPILFGRHAPAKDPRSVIKRATLAAERKWGEWRGYVLTYVLNDLDYLSKRFKVPVE